MKNKIDTSKDLMIVLHDGNCDHAFIYSSKYALYDKGDSYSKKACVHLTKPNSQAVFLEADDEEEVDDTSIYLDNYLPDICKGVDPKNFKMKVLGVFNSLDEYEKFND